MFKTSGQGGWGGGGGGGGGGVYRVITWVNNMRYQSRQNEWTAGLNWRGTSYSVSV